jgi:hypothetical protein
MQSPTELQVINVLQEYIEGTRPLGIKKDGISATYQNEEGNRCVIGYFLPDNKRILSSIKTVVGVLEDFRDELKYLTKHCSLLFLATAQNLHDDLCIGELSTEDVLKSLEKLQKAAGTEEAKQALDDLMFSVQKSKRFEEKVN